MPILATKEIIFSDEAHFDRGGFGAQKIRTHSLKTRRTQNESLFVAILVQRHNWTIFLGDRYRAIFNEFLFTKIEEAVNGNIWFQQDCAIIKKKFLLKI